MASTANPPSLRASFIALYRTFAHDLFGGYRPELHYMRGPGPKWRAKHQPWLKFDSHAVLPTAQHQLSSAHTRRRNAANPTQ